MIHSDVFLVLQSLDLQSAHARRTENSRHQPRVGYLHLFVQSQFLGQFSSGSEMRTAGRITEFPIYRAALRILLVVRMLGTHHLDCLDDKWVVSIQTTVHSLA